MKTGLKTRCWEYRHRKAFLNRRGWKRFIRLDRCGKLLTPLTMSEIAAAFVAAREGEDT